MITVDVWIFLSGFLMAIVVAILAWMHAAYVQPGRVEVLYRKVSEATILAASAKAEVSHLHNALKVTNDQLVDAQRDLRAKAEESANLAGLEKARADYAAVERAKIEKAVPPGSLFRTPAPVDPEATTRMPPGVPGGPKTPPPAPKAP